MTWRPVDGVECPECGMIYNENDVDDICPQCGYSPMFKIVDRDDDERT